MNILPGDVLFVWGKGLFGEAIELVTRGPSHCALFLDSKTIAEAQSGRTTGKAILSDYLGRDDHLEVWRDESLTDDERKRMVVYAKAHFGIHYDYLAILAELVRFESHLTINSFHEGKLRICSSYVQDCAKSVHRSWAKVSCPPAPVDLLLSGKLTRKGSLKGGGGHCI